MVLDVCFESGISLQGMFFSAARLLIMVPDKKLNPVSLVLLKFNSLVEKIL
jgi:hypothetical protein